MSVWEISKTYLHCLHLLDNYFQNNRSELNSDIFARLCAHVCDFSTSSHVNKAMVNVLPMKLLLTIPLLQTRSTRKNIDANIHFSVTRSSKESYIPIPWVTCTAGNPCFSNVICFRSCYVLPGCCHK